MWNCYFTHVKDPDTSFAYGVCTVTGTLLVSSYRSLYFRWKNKKNILAFFWLLLFFLLLAESRNTLIKQRKNKYEGNGSTMGYF